MRNRDAFSQLARKLSPIQLSPLSLVAHLLLRRTFSVPRAQHQALELIDLPRGITIVECLDERWIWHLAMVLHNEIKGSRVSCAINAQPLPFARLLKVRDDDTDNAGNEDEEIEGGRLAAILVPGDYEGRPDHVPTGAGRDIETDQPEKLVASLAGLMAMGSRTIIFVHDANELAPLVQRAADRLLEAPRLDKAAFSAMLKVFFSGKTTGPVPSLVDLDPTLLDLAFRLRDGAASYIERLNRLTEDRGSAPTGESSARPSTVPGFPRRLVDVHGMEQATDWARQLVTDLADYRAGRLGWDDVDRGAVFAGPPGTGKTRLAGLIAAEARVPLIAGSAARWQERDHGDNVQRMMADAFRRARDVAPSILLIDELDSFWSRQTRLDQNSSYYTNLVNGLLELLDGSTPRDGVVVIGTTNSPDRVDPALLRPGRLERVITVPTPNYDSLRAIIDFYAGQRFTDVELDEAARLAMSKRATGANVESWARAMRRHARHERREPSFEDFVKSINT